jgi:hypothetical protein
MVGTLIDLDSQDMGFPPSVDLDGRDDFGRDVFRDQVRQAFLFQDVSDALDSSGAFLGSDEKSASGGIGERHYGLQRALRMKRRTLHPESARQRERFNVTRHRPESLLGSPTVKDRDRRSNGRSNSTSPGGFIMQTILIVLVVLFLLGGGGWGFSRWRR